MSSAPVASDAAADVKRRRPILIWITQALAIVLGAFALFHAARWTLLSFTEELAFTPRLVGTVILQITFGVLAILVFVGLIRPATWARWLSVIFAICVSGLFFISQHGATPLTLTPSERVGAAVAEIVMVFVFALYPARLYYSKAVRRFFGINQRRSSNEISNSTDESDARKTGARGSL